MTLYRSRPRPINWVCLIAFNLLLLIAAVILCTLHLRAQSVRLEWDPNPEPDIAGYNIYRSTTAGTGYSRVNGQLITETTFTDTPPGGSAPPCGPDPTADFFWVATAVDNDGIESGFSNELTAQLSIPIPPCPPTGLTVTVGQGNTALLRFAPQPGAFRHDIWGVKANGERAHLGSTTTDPVQLPHPRLPRCDGPLGGHRRPERVQRASGSQVEHGCRGY